jgi:hypothetical protein
MKIEQIYIHQFDRIIEFLNSNFSSPTHWPEWNLLISNYYNTDFYYFGLLEEKKLIGICPVHETKAGLTKNLHSGQFHYIPNGGWLLNKEQKISLSKLPIPINATFECFSLPALKEFGTKYSKTVKLFYTLVVDLEQNEDEIWSGSINSKRRNMIRKSLRMGAKALMGVELLSDFYALYSESNIILGFEGLPRIFFQELIEESTNVHFVPFVAYYNDYPMATLGLIYDKDYALYWLGATKHNSENLGQGDLLQWEAIRYSRDNGCKYYDLCYIEKERLPQIYQFKKGFSNTEVEVPYLQRKRILFRILNKFKK